MIIEDGDKRMIIDEDTGEVKHTHKKRDVWVDEDERVLVVKSGRKREGRKAEFIKLYRTNIIDIIRNKKLSLGERGLFLSMLVFVDWESNFIVHPDTKKLLSNSALAELIGYDRKALEVLAGKLADKGLIAIIKNGNGRGNSYMINSNIAFNGRKMKDVNEHKVFDGCGYEPKRYIKY